MEKTWFKEPRFAWIGLGSLWVIGFIGALIRFIMAFFQVQISQDLEIGRGVISMAWSTNLLIAALCAPLGGWLVDRYGPRKILLLSTLIGMVGTGTVAFGHGAILFFLGYGIISGFTGLGSTTTYMLIFQWFRHHRAKATGLLASASSLGLAISTPLFVAESWLTWKDAFLFSFLLSIIVSLPVTFFGVKGAAAARTERHQKAPKARRSPLPPIAGFLPILITVAGALFVCGFNMGTVEMNLVAIHQLANVPKAMIAISMSTLGVMEICGSLLFGFLLDRTNKLAMLMLLYGIRIMGFVLLFLHLGWSPLIFAIAFGITYLSAIPGGLLIVNEYGKGNGKQAGWLLLFHQGGGIIGSLIGGMSYDYFQNYQALIGLDVLFCALIALGYFYLYVTRSRQQVLQDRSAAS
ncbi:MFS transporter [Gorillibacterium massiliense]|uniref:MFS transporter n=1 Tax=Gorillibacterium massiliense TaxID=1280390 RepID=UPI0004BC2BBC|nr:MFS transporter [Gorillibacterium massiliense]